MKEGYIERYLRRAKLLKKKEVIEALTHKSAEGKHYERLEFLGDSVIGLVVSEYLYNEFPELDVGTISKIKGYLVSKEVLYKIGKENNVLKRLIAGSALRKKDLKSNKKIISDVIESIIGSIYLIKGYKEAKKIIIEMYNKELKIIKFKKNFGDYKSDLQVKLLAMYNILPEYNVTRTEGKEHKKIFYVDVVLNGGIIGKGRGKTIKEAEQMAAKQAVKKIKK